MTNSSDPQSSAELSSSAQDYLEAIYLSGLRSGVARVSEVAALLDVKMPSVVVALKGLARKGLVTYQHYGRVELTPAGSAAARRVYDRHRALHAFLQDFLGLDAATAETDACRMEHALSTRTMKRLLGFLDFVGGQPAGARPCAAEFQRFITTGQRRPCSGTSA